MLADKINLTKYLVELFEDFPSKFVKLKAGL
jgi:hypothetical protein